MKKTRFLSLIHHWQYSSPFSFLYLLPCSKLLQPLSFSSEKIMISTVSLINQKQKHISKSCMSTFQKFGRAFLRLKIKRLKLLNPWQSSASRRREMITPRKVATSGMPCPVVGSSVQEGHGIPGVHWRTTKMFRRLKHLICEERLR